MKSYDEFVQSNPAWTAACVAWMAEGFAKRRRRGLADAACDMHLLWGAVGATLLCPDGVRAELPKTAAAHLSRLLHLHQNWRYGLVRSVEAGASAYWDGLRFGVAAGVFTLAEGKIVLQAGVGVPDNKVTRRVRRTAVALGGIFARERDDRAIASALGV